MHRKETLALRVVLRRRSSVIPGPGRSGIGASATSLARLSRPTSRSLALVGSQAPALAGDVPLCRQPAGSCAFSRDGSYVLRRASLALEPGPQVADIEGGAVLCGRQEASLAMGDCADTASPGAPAAAGVDAPVRVVPAPGSRFRCAVVMSAHLDLGCRVLGLDRQIGQASPARKHVVVGSVRLVAHPALLARLTRSVLSVAVSFSTRRRFPISAPLCRRRSAVHGTFRPLGYRVAVDVDQCSSATSLAMALFRVRLCGGVPSTGVLLVGSALSRRSSSEPPRRDPSPLFGAGIGVDDGGPAGIRTRAVPLMRRLFWPLNYRPVVVWSRVAPSVRSAGTGLVWAAAGSPRVLPVD